MNILSRGEAADIRQLFIDTFVDTTCNYFQNYILQMKSFSDGLRYTGYLWDCMIRRERVSYYFSKVPSRCIAEIFMCFGIFIHEIEYS